MFILNTRYARRCNIFNWSGKSRGNVEYYAIGRIKAETSIRKTKVTTVCKTKG